MFDQFIAEAAKFQKEREEAKDLKRDYEKLLSKCNDLSQERGALSSENKKLTVDLSLSRRANEELRAKVKFLEHEVSRLKWEIGERALKELKQKQINENKETQQ